MGSQPAQEQPDSLSWHLITSEYPPQPGGVSDYSRLVAAGLSACGDQVHVWCPAYPKADLQSKGFTVHRELGAISPADLRVVGRALDKFPAPRRLLVQWVPHGYGYKSMNLAFCWWLRNRASQHGDQVEIMVHEPYLSFRFGSFRQNAAALVHRLMTILLLRAAERVWVSIPNWEARLRPYTLGRRISFRWLPIPSNVPLANNPTGLGSVRARYAAGGRFLIGHFGTYGAPIGPMLEPILLALSAKSADQVMLLMGRGSIEFRDQLLRNRPELATVIQATGALAAEDLSCHLAACDLLIQPYPDGVSSRRGSFLAGLSHAKPIVTTTGEHTEPFWKETGAVALAPAHDVDAFVTLVQRMRADGEERTRMSQAALRLYQQRFDISHTIRALRQAALVPGEPVCVS